MKIELSGPSLPPASGGRAKQLVILLHGLGADGNDLISLAPEFAEILPDAYFISPNAPYPCDMAPFGFQWFSLRDWGVENMIAGAKRAAPFIHNFIDEKLEELRLHDKDAALIGFSQGTMMSLHVGLRRFKKMAGILGYSGAFLVNESTTAEITATPPVCLIHGIEDMVVPFAAMRTAEQALKDYKINVESHARPGLGHGIDMEGIDIGKKFLRKVFS